MTDIDRILTGELDRLGPSEWAFDTLMKIAAYGFHDSNRHALREVAKVARAQYREVEGTCPGCGHQPHDPEGDAWIRECPECSKVIAQRCSALRREDGTIRY